MERIVSKLKNIKGKDVTVLIVALLLVISPLIVDKEALPMGWELPKVQFIQNGIFALTVCFLIVGIVDLLFRWRKIELNKKHFLQYVRKPLVIAPIAIVSGLAIWFLVAYTQSPYPEIALNGNMFREMGLITIFLLMLSGFIVFKSVDRRNVHLIGFGLIVGALIQASIGLQQFYDLYSSAVWHDRIYEGFWVYGTFGQTNFFAGYLLVGLVFAFYYLATEIKLQVLLAMLSIVIISAGIFASYSSWSYVVTLLMVFMVVVEMFPLKRVFKNLLIVLPSISVFIFFIMMIYEPIRSLIPDISKAIESRIVIWDSIIKVYSTNTSYALFGTGFDTLGEVLRDTGTIPGAYIDRAHNLLLDIFASVGVIGLLLSFTTIVAIFVLFLLKKKFTRLDYYVLIAFQVVLIRAMIHTSSVVNTFLMVVIIAVALFISLEIKQTSSSKPDPKPTNGTD